MLTSRDPSLELTIVPITVSIHCHSQKHSHILHTKNTEGFILEPVSHFQINLAVLDSPGLKGKGDQKKPLLYYTLVFIPGCWCWQVVRIYQNNI